MTKAISILPPSHYTHKLIFFFTVVFMLRKQSYVILLIAHSSTTPTLHPILLIVSITLGLFLKRLVNVEIKVNPDALNVIRVIVKLCVLHLNEVHMLMTLSQTNFVRYFSEIIENLQYWHILKEAILMFNKMFIKVVIQDKSYKSSVKTKNKQKMATSTANEKICKSFYYPKVI